MRILHIIDSGGMYGAEMMLITLAKEQAQHGLDPVILSIGKPGCREKTFEIESKRQNLKVKTMRMHSGPNIFGAFRILNYAKESGFDIIHSHGYKGNILLGFVPGKIRTIPTLTTVHGWTSTSLFSKIKLYEIFDHLSLRFLDAVVVVNRNMLSLAPLQHSCKDHIYAINNGIAVEPQPRITLRNDIVRFCQRGTTIAAIGRLSSEKGFDVLLDAFSQVKKQLGDLHLLIIGEGSQRRELEMKIAEHGVSEHVYMPGFVHGACHYLSLVQLLVISSRSEGLPMTLLEAMREGIPVLASSVGGIPDTLENGECGILVPPGDEEQLVAGLTSSLQNVGYLDLLAQKARRRFMKHYSSERMCTEYSKIYKKLIM